MAAVSMRRGLPISNADAARAGKAGFLLLAGGPDALAARVKREVAFNRDIIERAGISKR